MVRLAWGLEGASNVKVAGLGTSRALAMLPSEGCSFAQIALRAPELFTGEGEIDARADVWGVGVLLYTMLAGEAPFGAESPSKMDLSAVGEDAPLLAGVPDGLAELVDACLARDASLRPPSAASLRARLALFGARPVFEKRGSLLVVDTGPYEPLVLEELVKEAVPSTPQVAPAPDKTPVPVVVTRSVPPVAITIAPPVAPVARARQWRSTALVAAACIGLGVVGGGVAMQRASAVPPPTPVAAAAAAHLAAPPAADPLPAPEVKASAPAQAAASVAAPDAPRAVSVSELPAMQPVIQPAPANRRPRGSRGAPAAADPVVQSASAPMQPQPKASDDDLRRFLDDRR
jgi:serine/threonine-protein kinase